ncbi:MAG: hypothetical protein K8J31_09850, partial [Anaerolineae bacterium]|nr:hypothetical protein [Anaerolineae bacterium]
MSDLILLKRTSIRFAILCIWAVVWGTFPAAAQNGIPASPPSYSLILFRDAISLTLYAPRLPDGVGVSIVGLIFQVSDESGTTAHSIERYAAFRGISFDNLPAPVCFHLKLAGSNVPIPIECGEGTLLLDQSLAASDVFWYDAATNEGRLITVVHHGEVVGICPAGRARCEMTYAVTVAPTPPVPTASTTTVPTTLPTETPAADPIPTIQYRGDKPVIQFANPLGVKGEVEAYQMNPGASNSAVQAVGCVTGGTNLALELATNIYLVVPFSEFRQAVKEGDKHRVTLANGDEFVTALSIT